MFLPSKLISDSQAVHDIGQSFCDDCLLAHRTKEPIINHGGLIDANVVDMRRFSTLSLNVLICNKHVPENQLCSEDDLKYNIIDQPTGHRKLMNSNFVSNEEVPKNPTQVDFNKQIEVVAFDCKALKSISGNYTVEKKQHTFKVDVVHTPTNANVFHYEIVLQGSHKLTPIKNHLPAKAGATVKPVFLEKIINQVRSQIIRKRMLKEVDKWHLKIK